MRAIGKGKVLSLRHWPTSRQKIGGRSEARNTVEATDIPGRMGQKEAPSLLPNAVYEPNINDSPYSSRLCNAIVLHPLSWRSSSESHLPRWQL